MQQIKISRQFQTRPWSSITIRNGTTAPMTNLIANLMSPSRNDSLELGASRLVTATRRRCVASLDMLAIAGHLIRTASRRRLPLTILGFIIFYLVAYYQRC